MWRGLALSITVAAGLLASAGPVEWMFPLQDGCHEGLPFSDGVTGVLVWGGGDTINLTVGRGDLWDHRGGYPWTFDQNYSNIVSLVRAKNVMALKSLFMREAPKGWNPGGSQGLDRFNPYMLPLGRVVVKIPGATLVRGELDPMTGLGRLILSNGCLIKIAMSKAQGTFAMWFPNEVEVIQQSVPATDFPVYEQTLKSRGFDVARMHSNGFTWELPMDKPVSLEVEKRLEEDGQVVYVWTDRSADLPKLCPASNGFDGIVSDSQKRWHGFWREGARVKVPDPEIQEIFDFGMYKFGSMTDPDGVAAGLQGQWLEDDRLVPWNGDYHFNINVQECYSPAYRGGHFRNLMPLFRMILSWRDRLRDNAKKFVGIDDGYVLPHSVDDRGVCIGGFWAGTLDHASTAWVAALMYRYVKYSGDIAFLRGSAYDFMKGAMNVYLAMMEERDGRLSIPLGPSPEWGGSDVDKCVGRNPSFQLAAAHRLAADLVSAANLIGDAVDSRWLDVQRRLPDYTADKDGFQLFEGQSLVMSHRHHSHMAGFYPFDTIDLSCPSVSVVAEKTYDRWIEMGTGQWTGWCVPWASILQTHFGHGEAAVLLLRNWKTFFNNPGHGSLHDSYRKGFSSWCRRSDIMQMDGQCAAVTAVMELMAHEVNGKIEFFKGCPSAWKDVSFENIALSDGRRASGRRHDGKIEIEYAEFR